MTNEDYQLEELENAAVNKSNNAKRIAAAAGLLATGGAAGYAATSIPTDEVEEPMETLTEEDLESVADTGANQVHEPEVKPQPVQPQPQPATPVQPTAPTEEIDVKFETTTHYYDANDNLVAMTEEGTIDGKDFMLLDWDGDKRADVLAYDENDNGAYEEDEIVELQGNEQIALEHAATHHEDVFLASNEPEPDPDPIVYYDLDEEKDYAQDTIHNDFEDEKTGETYSHDYAENNEDYDNGELEHYSAESSDGSDYAYDVEGKEENDYEYNDLAENDTTEDTFEDLGSDSLDIV